MKLLALVMLAWIGHAQTWTGQGATSRLSGVSPANCANSTPPAYCAGVTFDYPGNFAAVMTAWSSGVARTKAGSEQLLIFGGGHVATFDNAVYAINFNVSPATVSALTTPSIPTGSGSPVTSANITCASPNADGTPLSMHTYGHLVYLPVADKMFFWADGAGNYCATSGTREVWLFDPVAKTWAQMNPTGFNVHSGSDALYAGCALDPTTAHETVICEWGNNGELLRYDATANTWAQLTTFGSFAYPGGATMAIDPVRRIGVMMGTSAYNNTTLAITKFLLDSPYTATDITSASSGCAGMATPFPGIVYDPYSHNFMGYPGAGDTVYRYDPDTGVCAALTATGGPTAVNGTGTFGRWNYFPTLGKFVNVATVGSDAFVWQAPYSGLGSSTYTCLDRDGDGYGTGPGCTGPDADDTDPAVHTGAQAITKWSTLSLFLNHLGYAPLHTYYLSTAGSDSNPCSSSQPCLTYAHVDGLLVAGDMVIYRAGTFLEGGRFEPSLNGAAAAPIIAMAYPGESAVIDTTATSASDVSIVDRSYIVVDGLTLTKGLNNGCISGGTSSASASPPTFHDVILRHIEARVCKWGVLLQGLKDVTIEDSVWHDNQASGGEHGVYLGAKSNNLSSNITVRRNISYNNGFTGFQVNGSVANLQMDQNISYGNLIADYSWENGVHDSLFRSNLAMSWGGSGGLVISEYDGNEGLSICGVSGTDLCVCTPTPNLASGCAHDQTGNLIENFTAYGTTNGSDGISVVNSPAINVARQSTCTTATCLAADLGSNTFRNIIVSSNTDTSNHYQPVIFNNGSPATFLSTSTFRNILAYQNDASHGNNVIGWGPDPSFGWTGYTCSTAGSVTTLSSCQNADPQFVSAAPAYWNSIASFNFHLGSTSPAAGAGSTTAVPTFDLLGNVFSATAPSIGAISSAAAAQGKTTFTGKTAIPAKTVIR